MRTHKTAPVLHAVANALMQVTVKASSQYACAAELSIKHMMHARYLSKRSLKSLELPANFLLD
jgi:hypothetical protein